MTTFFLNYGLINTSYGLENEKALEVNHINKNKNKTAIEISVGSFHPGPYAPYQIKKKEWNNCNTINFCNLSNLFGKNIGLTYIRRYYEKNNHHVDIDSSIKFNSQKYRSKQHNFLMFSVVPTYRYYTKQFDERLNLGVGAGINLASGDMPSEYQNNKKINTQLNLEVAYRINKTNRSDLVIGVKHRCSLYGLIGEKYRGMNWYTIGFRKWFRN